MPDILEGCELVVLTNYNPEDQTKFIEQKCSNDSCNNRIGYYSKSGEPRVYRKNVKCLDCIQEQFNEACRNDQSHIQRLSAN